MSGSTSRTSPSPRSAAWTASPGPWPNSRASQVKFKIETKVEAGAPEQTAPREQFVDVALHEIKAADMQHRVSIESFDWGALPKQYTYPPAPARAA
ncbi:hypothetical protein R5O87_09720 [Arthrobacter globiformis]|uniref:hypothetical protein n=1 Tax=Arthrobacter globiformis TaxID=1665 RepID=UPI003977EAEC